MIAWYIVGAILTMHFLRSIAPWLGNHPLTLAGLTLVLGGIISIFSGDIREFIKIQPQRLNVWILKARLNAAIVRLQRTELMNASVHALAIYGLRAFCFASLGILITIEAIGGKVLLEARDKVLSKSEHTVILLFFCFGLLVGGIQLLNTFVYAEHLAYFEHYKRRMELKIARLQIKLEKLRRLR